MVKRMSKRGVILPKKPAFREQNGECHYCSRKMTLKRGKGTVQPDYATWDHVVPRIAGGTDDPQNLVLCCADCNHRKGSMSYQQFILAKAWQLPEQSSDLLKVQARAATRGDAAIIYNMARYCPACDLVMNLPN